jgi:diaminohydroxyphosphoribosylaminopyrimidine deaminase/5-amino-6-(5-phosphoribosylamino)uracil reductase
MTTCDSSDLDFMRRALLLAARGGREVRPNPRVGALLVRDGRVLAEGFHQRYGGPHAEIEALLRAGDSARGATLYVTLEPCAHQGKTGPCAAALLEAGVARVVACMQDPNPLVRGRGFERLRAAGVVVDVGLMAGEARELNRAFLVWVTQSRPYVTLKLAQSLDGRVALGSGESRWISSAAARERVHRLRAEADAVMVGIGTALIDDPLLTVRLVQDRSPIRIVLDPGLRLPPSAKLLAPGAPTWLIAAEDADSAAAARLERCGARILRAERAGDGRMDLRAVLGLLAQERVTDLLVEGGPKLATNLVRAGLVDRLLLFLAPRLLGGDALPWLGPLGLSGIDQAPALRLFRTEQIGPDLLLEARPAIDTLEGAG